LRDWGRKKDGDAYGSLSALLNKCWITIQNTANPFKVIDQIFTMSEAIAERARKLDGDMLRSIGEIARHPRLPNSNRQPHSPQARKGACLD
jgi:hypothetical protein